MQLLLQNLSLTKRVLMLPFLFTLFSASDPEYILPENHQEVFKQTNTYSSEVALKWLQLQWRITNRNSTLRSANENPSRQLAYTGIALYESVLPGMSGYQTLSGQLTDMPPMPKIQTGVSYHWSASANAALASIHKTLLPNISDANKESIDSLENALKVVYTGEVDAAEYQRSVEFGQAVAKSVYDWSKGDGFLTTNPPYVHPLGPGLWEPAPPNFAAATGAYWGRHRVLTPGILEETSPAEPFSYSTDPASPFYNMAKEVYNASKGLTTDQKAQGIFWRGVPVSQWTSILLQVLTEQSDKAKLDKATLAICKMGIVLNDVRITAWKAKYQFNRLRPITYIQKVMGHTSWSPLTPSSPEYPSGHASFYTAASLVLNSLFGNSYEFTDRTKDYLGLPPIHFKSFDEASFHGSYSRFYLGTNFKPSIHAGILLGNKAVEHMNHKIIFLKN